MFKDGAPVIPMKFVLVSVHWSYNASETSTGGAS